MHRNRSILLKMGEERAVRSVKNMDYIAAQPISLPCLRTSVKIPCSDTETKHACPGAHQQVDIPAEMYLTPLVNRTKGLDMRFVLISSSGYQHSSPHSYHIVESTPANSCEPWGLPEATRSLLILIQPHMFKIDFSKLVLAMTHEHLHILPDY